MGVIAGRTDRVVVMYGGKKAEESPTDELFHSMRHPYTQALLASMPSLETASKQQLVSIAGMPPDLYEGLSSRRVALHHAALTRLTGRERIPGTAPETSPVRLLSSRWGTAGHGR